MNLIHNKILNALKSPYLLLTLSPLFWSGNFLMGRIMHNQIPPFTLTFFRWLLVVCILTPWYFHSIKEYIPRIKCHFKHLCALSLLSVVIYPSFLYLGLHFTTVVNASLINACVPVMIVALSSLILKEPLSCQKVIGVLASILGVLLIITKGDVSLILKMHFGIGDLIILIAAVCWACFTIYLKKIPLGIPAPLFLLVTAIIGDVFLLPCYIVEHHLGFIMQFNSLNMLSIVYAAIFSSILAFNFWNIGVRQAGPAIAAYFFNLLTVFATLLAMIFLGEHFHHYHLYGSALVFAGICTTFKFRKKRQGAC